MWVEEALVGIFYFLIQLHIVWKNDNNRIGERGRHEGQDREYVVYEGVDGLMVVGGRTIVMSRVQ